MDKYGVQYQLIGQRIDVGRLNKKRNAFLDKEDHTASVLGAVAEFVWFTGKNVIEVGNYKMTIDVEKTVPQK